MSRAANGEVIPDSVLMRRHYNRAGRVCLNDRASEPCSIAARAHAHVRLAPSMHSDQRRDRIDSRNSREKFARCERWYGFQYHRVSAIGSPLSLWASSNGSELERPRVPRRPRRTPLRRQRFPPAPLASAILLKQRPWSGSRCRAQFGRPLAVTAALTRPASCTSSGAICAFQCTARGRTVTGPPRADRHRSTPFSMHFRDRESRSPCRRRPYHPCRRPAWRVRTCPAARPPSPRW